MASNPMQKKARNSFLAGMVLMLFMSSIIIVFLFLKLNSSKKQTDTGGVVSVFVLKKDIKSGEEITKDKLELVEVQKQAIPSVDKNNAGKSKKDIVMQQVVASDAINQEMFNKFKATESATTNYTNGANSNNTNTTENTNANTANSGNTANVATKYVAKTDLTKGTTLTSSMIQESERRLTADLRLQELNMLQLPSDLKEGQYVDLRIVMPTGQDYIIVPKKKVIKTSETTMWVEMNEEEILSMSNAIVEAYIIKGANLYATRYAEPGMQEEATPTYPVSKDVVAAIEVDPNITDVARNALYERYNDQRVKNLRNGNGDITGITNILNQYSEDAKANLEQNIEKQVTKAKEERKKYMEELKAAQTQAASQAQANNSTASSAKSTTSTTSSAAKK